MPKKVKPELIQYFKKDNIEVGIDEAGRGCVLGSLFVGACCCLDTQLESVVQTGATDSKKLSAKKRVKILEQLENLVQTRYISISPQEIDNGNINTLEEEAFAKHIIHYQPDRVYIDAPVHPRGIPSFINRLKERLHKANISIPELIVEPKADLNYPIVGAASIVAKVYRDKSIEALGSVGSGYPSDPKTRNWIKGFFLRDEPLPASVRTRWGTIASIKAECNK